MKAFRVTLFLAPLMLSMIPANAWAIQDNDSVPRLRHEVAFGIGIPGLYPTLSSVFDGGLAGGSKGGYLLPTFYFQYLYYLNKSIGIGVTANYSHSHWGGRLRSLAFRRCLSSILLVPS